MKEELNEKDLLERLLNYTQEELEEKIEDIHPADVLDLLHDNEDDFFKILKRSPDWFIAAILEEEEDEEKYEILKKFSESEQKKILGEMSSDELTDLVGALDEEETRSVLKKINEEDRKDVYKLLSYEPDTAGGIMATEFVSIRENKTIEKTLKYLQKEAPDAESAYYLYVINKENVLKGVVSLRDIVCNDFDTKISEITNTNVISVPYYMDQEEVAIKFEKYGFMTMPVVDENNKILGIVTVDDIVEVMQEETTEDIHRLGGVDEEEKVDGSLRDSIKSRLPWLIVNLITAILAASVVGAFEGTISQVVTLATFMPIVAGMGGNAGTQSLTIVVRGIALGELDKDNGMRIFIKELLVGLTTGIVIGAIIAVLGFMWERNFVFGIVIGLAMILNMMVATMSGFIVPVILKKLKVDPALASAVFVTTVTDVLGFFFFLGLATMFISYLI
ncbi:magnesium transporter [Clostridium paraputrificum]|uniref:magnesium transporter n=1 Tax=Clostridium paraputrificum TaxID=29363 RepID=UPI000C077D47|nr:magnesium transporter [Clostridium paraputrificum]MDB2085163.1 magnesium transporter [Clostridium paraputrificum]MDB2092907.1 magnesium transporter [Clostridium paraputrificum]MDB2117406.1 magnesium transporter [Clostridium paraputrificum]MDU6810108.1 magnesium transporter [Clostridium sp.]